MAGAKVRLTGVGLARRLYRNAYPALQRVIRIIAWPFVFLEFILEYVLLVLPHLRDMRSAEAVYPMFMGSFGHQAVELHMLGMRFKGRPFLVLFDDYRNFNPYIIDAFRSVVDIRMLRHTAVAVRTWRRILGSERLRAMKQGILRMLLRLTGSRAAVLREFCGARAEQVEGSYITEYLGLLREHPHVFATPPPEPVETFERALLQAHPELRGKWFVALYLRRKHPVRHDVRDTDPAPYRAVIARIVSAGGFVLCGGDYEASTLYPDVPGVLGYGDLPLSRFHADLYMLSRCRFFIGGHSGPVVVATAFNRPALITNNAFFYLSGYLPSQRVIWKKLRDASGRILAARETFSFPIVAYIENEPFENAGLRHVDNTADELVAATEEMLDLTVRGIRPPEDQELEQRFRSLLPGNAVAAVSPCRPAVSYLRSLAW